MYIDTHAHLDFPEFKGEIGSAIARAKDVGVEKIINVGVDLGTSKRSVEIARHYPEVFASVGLHPHSSLDLDMEVRPYLTDLAKNRKVIAVGEIGLDYYYLKRSSKFANYPKREDQIFCFEQMLDLALELRLPVIVHSREAEADIYAILKSYSGALRGVIHCFSGDYEFAKKILDLNFLISFTGNITYSKSKDIEEVIKKTPLGSIMIETDCPYLAPELYRGERNEPAYVVEVAKKIAEIKQIPIATVEQSTSKKSLQFFGME
jgi:TatD DNase family protein